MASGHVNRTKRPNTWLHRPPCMREESPCQLGAVHTWHWADEPACPHSRRVLEGKRTYRGPRNQSVPVVGLRSATLVDL